MSNKILWKTVRRFSWAWDHVKTILTGKEDRVMCRRCRAEVSLRSEYRTKASINLEFARKHFYKCVVPTTLLPETVVTVEAVEPELFYGQV